MSRITKKIFLTVAFVGMSFSPLFAMDPPPCNGGLDETKTYLYNFKETIGKRNFTDNFRAMLRDRICDYRIPVLDEKINKKLGIFEITNVPNINKNMWNDSQLNESRRNFDSMSTVRQQTICHCFPIEGKDFGIQYLESESGDKSRYLSAFKKQEAAGIVSYISDMVYSMFAQSSPPIASPCDFFSVLINSRKYALNDINNLEKFRKDLSNDSRNRDMNHVVQVGLYKKPIVHDFKSDSKQEEVMSVEDDSGNYHMVFIGFLNPMDIVVPEAEYESKV